MIYVVTGDGPRCGSVMMMRSLWAGGMSLAFQPAEDRAAHIQATEEYHPNAEGLFEVGLEVQRSIGFPQPDIFEGRVIKLFGTPWGQLTDMVPGEYRMIWLHRAAEKRWASFHRFHEKVPIIWCDGDEEKSRRAEQFRDAKSRETLALMLQRPDVEVSRILYDDVVDAPLDMFRALEKAGWPIDPKKAATVPDPSRRRF